jgi:hypothetical protein
MCRCVSLRRTWLLAAADLVVRTGENTVTLAVTAAIIEQLSTGQ